MRFANVLRLNRHREGRDEADERAPADRRPEHEEDRERPQHSGHEA